ncbi:MAG: SxtJ family membrane protein [Salinispira sp.]
MPGNLARTSRRIYNMPSNKTFGYFFSMVFIIAAVYAFLKLRITTFQVLFIALAALTFLTTIIVPKALYPFNWLWYKLGLVLGFIVRPVMFGILFFITIVPVGVIMRLSRRDELELKKYAKDTYWKIKEPDEPYSESFRNQF